MATAPMVVRHASTATSKTSPASSSPNAAKRTGNVTAILGLEAKTAQSLSAALLQMDEIAHREEMDNASARRAGRASTAMCAKRTMLVML
jgi:hypothetical protein